MTKKTLSIKEATDLFKISKRTLERKIAAGIIKAEAISTENGARFIAFDELERVFGKAPADKKEDPPEEKETPAPADTLKAEAKPPEGDLIAELRAQLAQAHAREEIERIRADRLESELIAAQKTHNDIVKGFLTTQLQSQKLLADPKPKRGFLSFFGFGKK